MTKEVDVFVANFALWAENAALRQRVAELEQQALAATQSEKKQRRRSLKTGDIIRVSLAGVFNSGTCIVTSVKYQLGDYYHYRAGGKIKKRDERIHFAPCPHCPDYTGDME